MGGGERWKRLCYGESEFILGIFCYFAWNSALISYRCANKLLDFMVGDKKRESELVAEKRK